MKNRVKKYSLLDLATVAWMVVCCVHPVFAGTQGAYMNSAGYGKAVDAVTYGGVTSKATSIAMYYPCAAVNPQGFQCGYTAALPPGTPTTVFCQSQGFPNYRWSIQSYVTGGATADHPELENRITVAPANCASYTVTSDAVFTDAYSGSIMVSATATAGTAVWLRGFEFLGAGQPGNLEELLANSALKWDMLLSGPFDLQINQCTGLTVPFTTTTGHANLYFVVEGLAKSAPFAITCPGDVSFGCAEPVVYPPAQVSGGCGNITVSYDPPADQLPLTPTLVTATATDESGNTAQCTFTASRQMAFVGFAAPINGTGGTCVSPLRSFNRRSKIPVQFTLNCAGAPITTGKPTLSIQPCAGGAYSGGGDFQLVGNDWWYEWDTRGESNTSALPEGTYHLVATLQDGSQQEVFIRLVEPFHPSPASKPAKAQVHIH